MELDGGNINAAQHSDKVGQVSSRCSGRGSYRPVEIERILRRNISKYIRCFLQSLGYGHQLHFPVVDTKWFRFRLSLLIIPEKRVLTVWDADEESDFSTTLAESGGTP